MKEIVKKELKGLKILLDSYELVPAENAKDRAYVTDLKAKVAVLEQMIIRFELKNRK